MFHQNFSSNILIFIETLVGIALTFSRYYLYTIKKSDENAEINPQG